MCLCVCVYVRVPVHPGVRVVCVYACLCLCLGCVWGSVCILVYRVYTCGVSVLRCMVVHVYGFVGAHTGVCVYVVCEVVCVECIFTLF